MERRKLKFKIFMRRYEANTLKEEESIIKDTVEEAIDCIAFLLRTCPNLEYRIVTIRV